MTVDTEARRLAAVTRRTTASTLDIEAGLANLRSTAVRRRRLQVVGALAAVGALTLGISLIVPDLGTDPAPAGRSSEHPSQGASGTPSCSTPRGVRCVGPTTFAIDAGDLSFVVDVPTGFSPEPAFETTPQSIDVYQDDTRAGVSILLGARAATGREHADASGLAEWVQSRPFLAASEPEPTTVSGLTGWRVETHWAADVRRPRLSASCNASQPDCRPVLAQERSGRTWETGIWQSMVGSYTFLDLPDGQVVALWSWAFGDARALAANDRLLASVEFETAS